MSKAATKQTPPLINQRIEKTLARIDEVLLENRGDRRVYILLTFILFFAGIYCLIEAITRGEFGWSIPPAITTALLHWPLKAIRDIRQKNIALAVAPAIISLLPAEEAIEEIKKLLCSLYP